MNNLFEAIDSVKCTPDLTQAMPIIERLCTIAGRLSGRFVIGGLGEDPEASDKLDPENISIPNDARRGSELSRAVDFVSRRPGANAYIIPSLMRADLPDDAKGTERDVVGVLAIVLEFDAKHDPATRLERLPVHPHAEVESSPGNFQSWVFFDRPYSASDVKPVLVSLVDKVGCDHCKSTDHYFRVPGCLNWASKLKQTRDGRSAIPVRARLVSAPEDWQPGISLDDLKCVMIAKWGPDVLSAASVGISDAGSSTDFDWEQTNGNTNRFNETTITKRLNDTTAEDRSSVAFAFMKKAKAQGHTPNEIVEMFLRYRHFPIPQHYASAGDEGFEKRVRDDVVRAFTKEDKSGRTTSSADVFRIVLDTDEACFLRPERRMIRIAGGELPQIIAEAEAALIEQGTDIFQRGSFIVRPSVFEDIETARHGKVQGTKLVPVKLDGMVVHMTAAADFQRFSSTCREWRSVDCPKDVAKPYLEGEGQWRLRPLTGVINAPMLRVDGSVLDQPGYDPKTGVFYIPGSTDFPAIPAQPSRADARIALATLRELIAEFPFTSDASRAVALSGFLTALVRRSLPAAPLHGYSAFEAGTGKGLLVDTTSWIATGNYAASFTQEKGDVRETMKRLASRLIAGHGFISLDNCTDPLEGDLLCQVLTQQRLSIRLLGHSRDVETTGGAFMAANGNNLTFAGDMTRRGLRCEIDAGCERPELRKFTWSPLDKARRERGRYVAAALTVLRSWIVAGRPDFPGRKAPVGSFEDWCRLVRDALMWLGEADPCDTMEDIRAHDPEADQLRAILHGWGRVIGGQPVTASEAIRAILGEDATGDKRAFAEALQAVAAPMVRGIETKIDPTRLGYYLRRVKGKVRDQRHIKADGKDPKSNAQIWRLVYPW